jgi:hypothetical protein
MTMLRIRSMIAWVLLSLGSLAAVLVWSAYGSAAGQQEMAAGGVWAPVASSQADSDDDADANTMPADANADAAEAAATTRTDSAPAEDLLRGPIDPYDAAAEKRKFFRAAGADGELDEQKFNADAARKDGFVRKFDNWEAMLAFDKDGIGTIDWFAADAYRRAIRKRILDAFDTRRIGKLTGVQRQAANAALASGRFTAPAATIAKATATTGPATTGPVAAGLAATSAPVNASRLLARLAADETSKLSPEDVQAAMKALRDAEEQALLQKYGKEGETKLTKEEWAQVAKDRQKPWQDLANDMNVILFDTEGNGTLSEEQEKQAKEFQARLHDVFKDIGKKVVGDPKSMSDLEQAKLAVDMGVVGLRVTARINQQMDPAQTGFVSEEARRKFNENAAGAVRNYMKKFIAPYADSDGKYGPGQRQKIIDAFSKDMDARIKKVHGGQGRPTPDEMVRITEDFLKDVGVLGDKREDEE